MINSPLRTSKQPKLRFSCDGCGSAKLKCDRGQPKCGRCVSLGITCVYGVSRKMGKPPRERLQIPTIPGVTQTAGKHKERRSEDNSYSRRTGGSISDFMLSRSGSSSSVHDVHSAWGAVDNYSNDAVVDVSVLDALHNDRLEPPLANFSFPSLDAGRWPFTHNIRDDISSTNLETEFVPALGWPETEGSPASTAQTTVLQAVVDDRGCLNTPLMPHDNAKHHDCSREAYDILGTLSFLNLSKADSAAISGPGATARTANRVPLDLILQVNREASERLGCLLSCSCANYPHLAFLHASIISRVLLWYYQEAAGCLKSSSWGPTSHTAAQAGTSPSSSILGSLCRSPPSWSSAAASAANTNPDGSSRPLRTQATSPVVPLTQMTMGCFNIDDQRVQTALRFQLLLGEMKRIGGLIDVFTSRSSGGIDGSTSGNIDTLYKSLGSWLGGEHSSIVEMIRFRLREVSI
ncbi:hypothetical protein F4779DRAFT_601803 [Xylariaceae sp. FL0662B]|nr:hypothetical protein F4779DRAFT_601803 [Xylariaceae sp. FL0662B]